MCGQSTSQDNTQPPPGCGRCSALIREKVRFHDLRHTYAIMAIRSGVDPKTVSSVLGHYSADFTLDIYTHVTGDMQKMAAEKIDNFISQAV